MIEEATIDWQTVASLLTIVLTAVKLQQRLSDENCRNH
jgi:hypothetical protein